MDILFRKGFEKQSDSAYGRYLAAKITGGLRNPRELAALKRKSKGTLKEFLGLEGRATDEAKRYETRIREERGKEVLNEAGIGLNFSWTPDTGDFSVLPSLKLDPLPMLDKLPLGAPVSSAVPNLGIGDKIGWLLTKVKGGQ